MAGRLNRNINFPKPVNWKTPSGDMVQERSLGALLQTVHRLRSYEGGDLAPGWELRLQDEICAKPEYINMCTEVDERESSDDAVKYIGKADVQRFFNTAKQFIAGGGQLVDKETATKRAEVCKECPRNVPIRGCMGCSGLIPKLLKLTKGASTEHDKELKGCSVCGCQLKAKVHLPAEMNQDEGIEFPDWCWISKEIKS